ncbi:DUF6629 family protein [Cyclobacterium plantarum]|uniref:Uncharacterized protein n=1 Tax=Cyclobacterium plantarum TaxID=2716263 RepID=A0ABX0HAB5_9BACT|nr:DUF6629 family protein [Cyclobacterium plantarum]NHE58845.1 hypothetical protein [Cyclobacterium plantarum]
MCFSAGASFGASILLGTIGIASIQKTKNLQSLPFASIPMFFALQQIMEGMLWIGLGEHVDSNWRFFPTLIFLGFSQVLWPIWVPLSILFLENNQTRRKVLSVLLLIGISVSCYFLYCMIAFDFSAEIRSGHIKYTLDFPVFLEKWSGAFYFLPIVLSPFLAGRKEIRFLGIAVLISFLITMIFFSDYLISIWCFFAALLSILVFGIVLKINKE